ncbi:MAG TPA: hypothetical protein VNJ02_10535 [Vicinamibacterales bacterium]|nr:hypothetical protein [Vicinamibacterales bacterium]
MRPYLTIGRPRHEFGTQCATVEAYRGLMIQQLLDGRAAFPDRNWGTPHAGDHAHLSGPLISHGVWKVKCPCGDEYPIYDPEWEAACCFSCGAMYQDVAPPARWRDIERVLLCRRHMHQRNYAPPETYETLCAENLAHADGIF